MKAIRTSSLILLSLLLLSWGSVGHRTIGLIAEHHLTPQVKLAVKAYLGDESLADVSNWADGARNQPEFKYTAPWHYLDLPVGLNHEEFIKAIYSQQEPNIYGALMKNIADIKIPTLSMEQRINALKFVVHFVGDAHQPMHVSRAEDKGGNTIQVQFDGRATNLHSVWDTKLIDHQGLSYEQMAKQYDTAMPQQIKQWQSSDIMQWLWESYQLSSKFYKEVEINNKLGDAYYNEHIEIVKQRIEMAGIRLAGILNQLFDNNNHGWVTKVTLSPPPSAQPTPDSSAVEVELKDLPNMLGKEVVVKGKVYSLKDFGKMTLVNLGAAYPNQLATIVLKGEAKKHYSSDFINGKTLTVIGVVKDFKGKPEIEVMDSDHLSIE